jgi:SlyX protein
MSLRMNDSARIDALEIKLAHLERALSEISDVVIRQQRELDLAVARQQRLRDQLAMLESEGGTSATAEEKPPHY